MANRVESWLPYVKTATARGKIKHWFREKDRADALELGKTIPRR